MKVIQTLLIIGLAVLSACGHKAKKKEGKSDVTIPSKTVNTEGRDLFNQHCASCHAIDSKVIGPALKGVDQRHKEDWIINFVLNSTEMIDNEDPEALAIYNEYQKVSMTKFQGILDKEKIQQILAYIKEKS